jgi:hypothetical protein
MTRLLAAALHRLFPPTGTHRRTPGPLVTQRFVVCPCGTVTAATVHGDMLRCDAGHLVTGGRG